MSSETKELIKFKYPFTLPTQDFLNTEIKELTVSVEHKKSAIKHYVRGTYAGAYSSERAYFVVQIPKYLLEYVKGKLKQYTKDSIGIRGHYEGGAPIYDEQYNFTNFIRRETLMEVAKAISEITSEAMHIKRFEELETHSKVIFVYTKYNFDAQKDNYNFGMLGNKVDLDFQFFIAYKVEKDMELIKMYWQENAESKDKVFEYYAVSQAKSNYGGAKKLPLIDAAALRKFKQIPWTQQREDFFTEIENKIKYVADKINSFVSEIDTENIDLMIEQKNTLKLEDKHDKT